MTSKRKVGIVLLAGAALVGVAAGRAELLRRDLQDKYASDLLVAEQARDRVQAAQRSLIERAQIAAATPPLLAALEDHVDRPTLVDLFQSEDWWRDARSDFSMSRIVVGADLLATAGGPDPGTADRKVVSAARKGGEHLAASIETIEKQPYFVIAVRLNALGDKRPVLVVSKAVDPAVWAASQQVPTAPASDPSGTAFLVMALVMGIIGGLSTAWPSRNASPIAVPHDATTRDTLTPWVATAAEPTYTHVSENRAYVPDPVMTATPAAGSTPPPATPAISATPIAAGPPRHPSLPGGVPISSEGKPGKTFGRYQLLDRLGEGGMAEVFTAVAHGVEGFSRVFVLKRLRPELAHDKEAIGQFIDEARMQASLVHSNIVPVFDFGRVADEYFMTQEYIVGRDLVRLIARNYEHSQQTLDPKVAYYIAHETLLALEYAHGKRDRQGQALGIVHRDVSAGNILVSAQGEVKLSDFGIVKSNRRVTKTQVGMVKGNANFMSPEQARGQNVDARSDLFSIALVLYYCLTNRLLYDGENDLDVLYKAASGPTPEDLQFIRKLPSPARDLLLRAFAINPNDRYQSGAEFAAALAPHIAGAKHDAARLMTVLFGEELGQEAA